EATIAAGAAEPRVTGGIGPDHRPDLSIPAWPTRRGCPEPATSGEDVPTDQPNGGHPPHLHLTGVGTGRQGRGHGQPVGKGYLLGRLPVEEGLSIESPA